MVRMRGVTTMGVGWASRKVSNLVGPPLNLVLYMYLRMFVYTSNTLIPSFEYMDCMLDSDTLKDFMFLMRSWWFTERAPVMKVDFVIILYCSLFSESHVFLRFEQESNRDSLCTLHRVLSVFILSYFTWIRPRRRTFSKKNPLRPWDMGLFVLRESTSRKGTST